MSNQPHEITDRHVHLARAAVSAVMFVNGAALGGYITHLRDIEISLAIGHDVLGRALLASGLGAVVSMPFSGTLIHKFGSRVVSTVAGICLCALLPLLMLVNSLAVFAAVLFWVGVSTGQMDVAMNAHAMAVQSRFSRPVLSAIHGWFSIGGFAGGGGAALAAKLGLSPFMHLLIASAVLIAVVVTACVFMLPAEVDKDAEGPRFAWPKGPLFVLGVLVTLAFVAEAGVWDWSAVYLRTTLKASEAVGSIGFGLFSFGMAIGRLNGDRFVHAYGPGRVLAASGFLATSGMALGLSTMSPIVTCLGFLVAGLGIANTVPVIFAAAANQPGISAGVGLAAITTFGYSGFLGGPPVIGMVAEHISLRTALACIAGLSVALALTGPKFVELPNKAPS